MGSGELPSGTGPLSSCRLQDGSGGVSEHLPTGREPLDGLGPMLFPPIFPLHLLPSAERMNEIRTDSTVAAVLDADLNKCPQIRKFHRSY